MLFAPIGSQKPIRVQGCFVSDNEIESIAGFMKSEGNHEYDVDIIEEIEKNAVEDKGKAEGGIASEDIDPMIPGGGEMRGGIGAGFHLSAAEAAAHGLCPCGTAD